MLFVYVSFVLVCVFAFLSVAPPHVLSFLFTLVCLFCSLLVRIFLWLLRVLLLVSCVGVLSFFAFYVSLFLHVFVYFMFSC